MTQPFLDRCIFLAASGGIGSFVETVAVTGFQTVENGGGTNGQTLYYAAQSDDLSQWEVGQGVWSSVTLTLTRATVFFNSIGTTAKINFTQPPQVMVTIPAETLLTSTYPVTNTSNGVQGQTARDPNGNFYVCYEDGAWTQFLGISPFP